VVQACTDVGVYERAPSEGFTYRGFTDPSGGSGSSFTLAVGHAENGKGMLDLTREVRPPFDPSGVVWEFAELLRRYRVKRVAYGGEWPREAFRKQGIIYEPCKDPKSILYLGLLPLLNSGQVRLLDDARLKSQLLGLERFTGRSGKDSIVAADNDRDDVVNSAAGVLVEVMKRKPQIRINGCPVTADGRPDWNRLRQRPEPGIRLVQTDEFGVELSSEQACALRHGEFHDQ
jgi:hypothetical protein